MKKISKAILIMGIISIFLVGCKKTDGNGITVVSREDGSGTRAAFVELVGIEDEKGNDITTEEAIIQNNTEAVMSTITGDKNAIGYISLGSLNDKVKALEIDGVEPSSENIKNNEYKISRPFNIVTKDDNEVANEFIKFILSSNGQEIVEKEGYISSVENPQDYNITEIEGNLAISGSSSITPVMEKLVEAYKNINPNVSIQVNLSDSTTGVQSVIDGIAQIGMVSRELKDSEKSLNKTTIALDGIAVITNKENSANDISIKSLKDVYTEEITTWDDIK